MKYLIGFYILATVFWLSRDYSSASTKEPVQESTCGRKALASHWTRDSGDSISLKQTKLGEPVSYQMELQSGVTCEYQVTFKGQECSGTMEMTGAQVVKGNDNGKCSIFNGQARYLKSESGLSICDISGCFMYK